MASSQGGVARNVFLAAIEPDSGKSLVALGLMEALARRSGRVGFFRPVVAAGAEPGADVGLLRRPFRLAQSYEESFAVTEDDLAAMSDRGQYDLLLKRILEAFRRLDQSTDLVLVEGGDLPGASRALELDFNAELANHLGCLVMLVVRGSRRSAGEVLDAARLAHGSLVRRRFSIPAPDIHTGAPLRVW